MDLKKSVKAFAFAGLAAAVTVTSFTASAGPRVKWKMQSAFGSTLVHLGPGGLRFVDNIKRMSEGKFQIKFFEPGALVPPWNVLMRSPRGPSSHAGPRLVITPARSRRYSFSPPYLSVLNSVSSWRGRCMAAVTTSAMRSMPNTI